MHARGFDSRGAVKSEYFPRAATSRFAARVRDPESNLPPSRINGSLPVTADTVRCHLCGRDKAGHDFVMGVYLMLRKPFDILAEGLVSKESLGDRTAIELFLAGIRGWEAGLRRQLVDGMSAAP